MHCDIHDKLKTYGKGADPQAKPRSGHGDSMPLTILSDAVALFGKLKRYAEALEHEVSADRVFNFVVTGYSLIDWVSNDPTMSATAKSDVHTLRKDQWIKVCGDLATAAKHFVLTSRRPIITSTNVQSGWGSGRYGKDGYGKGESTNRR